MRWRSRCAAAARQIARENNSMPRSLSILAATFESAEVREIPRLARQLGFDGLLFNAFGPRLNIPDLSASGRREFRHALSSQNQSLVGLRVDLPVKGFSIGADVDRQINRIAKTIDAAAGLMAPLVCIDLGPLPAPPSKQKPKPKISQQQAGLILIPTTDISRAPIESQEPKSDPEFVSQVDAALIELGRLADRASVTIAFASSLASFAAIDRALRAADCPWFGIDLDPVALLRDEWSIDEVFSNFGDSIRHVRARDAQRGADRRTKSAPIGQGDVSWQECLTALDRANFSGTITIDPLELPDRTMGAKVGANFLRGLVA